MLYHRCLLGLLASSLLVPVSRAEVVISEIMYHPLGENSAEEYIEVHNNGGVPVDVSGWKFTRGVVFDFPTETPAIPAGGYLVVAADDAAFTAKYPTVSNFVAGWAGQLSNSSNTITLTNSVGAKMDEVDYSDDGDWGERRRQEAPDNGHLGWVWRSDADGAGKSLELINPLFDNSTGQNWASSASVGGTPGAANSVAAANIAPVISKVAHFPLVPKSADAVTITCQVRDDSATSTVVKLFHRVDGANTFDEAQMLDDGMHGDGVANDGFFGAILPPQANGTIVEFYVSATDAGTLTRAWPAPARDGAGLVQTQNCLYQVDDTVYAGAMPIYRMIMRATERVELGNINTDTGPIPYPPADDQTHSHSRFNATFISQDGTGSKSRYLAGARNRGNGSRSAQPQSFNVQFPNDDAWNGLTSLVLNSQNTPWQLLGSAIFRQSGLAAMESRAVQVRVNGVNPVIGTGAPAYGFYVCNEFQNSEFAERHFPIDSSGNIYRGQRLVEGLTAGGTALTGATLEKIIPAPTETLSLVDLYKLNYRKETNISEDAWTDLLALTNALGKGHSGAAASDPVSWDADYVASVQATADVSQWMRWFAVQAFLDNEETNLSNGDGDDYYIYFGKNDPRGKLLPYDLDTILGRSATSNLATHGIFRMIDLPNSTIPVPANPFMKHPAFVPLYYAEMKRLLDGPFNPAEFDPLVDQVLGGIAPVGPLNTMKSFNAARHAHIATLVPLVISVTNSQTAGGTALGVVGGYPQSTASACKLIGKANAIDTRSVKVSGVAATWSAWEAKWTADNVALVPGVNRILIQAFDGDSNEIDRAYHEVWFDDGTTANYSGTLAASETWTAAGGPYNITADFTIPAGVTLTIAAGASVHLGSGVDIIVANGGRIIADGNASQVIRFDRVPNTAVTWSGIDVNGAVGSSMSVFRHCHFENTSSYAIDVNAGNVEIDFCTFSPTCAEYISLDGASFLVSNCVFPPPNVAGEVVHGTGGVRSDGRGILRDCFFGAMTGYNDVFDFTGGNRPGPILQFINNVCVGSDDDILDLDGTDAWVESNLFMHVHRLGSPDSASAVSGGSNGSDISHVTVVGNLFYDVDQACTAKQGNFYTFLNNTVIDQNGRGSDDTEEFHTTNDPQFLVGVLNFADDGTTSGAGAYAEGNIIHSAERLARNYSAANSAVTWNNNIFPVGMTWTGPGAGNEGVDPHISGAFVDSATGASNIATPTAANFRYLAPLIRAQLGLGAGSPAKGTGPNGTDKGGVRPFGVSLGGAPEGITNQTSASISVGTLMSGNGIPATANAFPQGSGWTQFQWRLDGGAWSAEMPLATPITLTNLTNGTHTVEVVGRNDAGFLQNDPVFGGNARVSSATWIVDTNFTPPPAAPLVRINEVLALNTETINFGTAFPDIIELHNAGNALADISGWGLTDNSSLPYKYTIPAGTTLAPGAYKIIYASGSSSVPQPRSGFGLKREGDTLTLSRSAAAGGGVADKVPFGWQLADYSIGRRRDGSWALCQPTFGAVNVLAGTAPISSARINEWLADAVTLSSTDFIELTNTSMLPVDVGNCYLTENPSDWPAHFQIRQLTFIGPGGYLFFKADDDEGAGPDHLNFKLDALQGEIGFLDPQLQLVDSIVYGPQSTDVSQGRSPNGTGVIAAFTQPTPGGPNPVAVGTISTSTTNLIPAPKVWKYFSSAAAGPANDVGGMTWTERTYADAAWNSRAQLLYIENASLTNTEGFAKEGSPNANANLFAADGTTLLGFNATHPYQTYYFRTHFTWNGPLTGVTLAAKFMIDDGAVIYLNGVEVRRVRMPAGTADFAARATAIATDGAVETIDIPAASLLQGDNVLAISVHQQATVAQSATAGSSDLVFGLKLDATVTTGYPTFPAVLNEALAWNASLQNPDGSFAGWIELHNPSDIELDLGDMSLSNSVTQTRRFVFPSGTLIPAGGYLTVQCNGLLPVSATNTGFSLSGTGGFLGLFHTVANGGGLHDSISYGRQIADFSIGRSPNGTGPWALCAPTRGGFNNLAATAPLTSVKINEWLASPTSGADFFELFNTAALPVALGGNFLTDSLLDRFKHPIPALSFIGGSGMTRWQNWIADNNNSGTPEHVNFELNGVSGESLGLFTAAGQTLDAVSFGVQNSGQSSGRYPDGSSAILTLVATPGAANQLPPAQDTDGDLIPDAWEVANGFNPNDPADGALDLDGDGQSNRAEYFAGTNPQIPNDALRAVLGVSGGKPAISFTRVEGKTYTVQFKNALNEATWTKLTDVSAQPGSGWIEVLDNSLTLGTQRFYRVVTPAQP